MTRIEHALTIEAAPVFARMARRDFTGNFETLKDILEARNDSRTDGP